MDKFIGTGVALITPFIENGDVDYIGLEKLVNYVYENGVNYLVVNGTTAENPTLTKEEKREILDVVLRVNDSRMPIAYGIGGNNTAATIEDFKSFDLNGVDAILSVSPYYNKPTQEGIYQHYKALSAIAPLPIILYNVPGRTSSNISSEVCLRLAHDFDNIIGIKEASGDFDQIMEIAQGRPEGFLLISGDDNLSLPMMAVGGNGVISVSGQGFPSTFTAMVDAALNGDIKTANEMHYKLFNITQMLFEEGNPGGIKAVLKDRNICGSKMRLPLWPISEGLEARIKAEIISKGI